MADLIWHYTCDHSAADIRRELIVRPNHHPLLGYAVAWFTDLDAAYAYEVGLTSDTIACDRTAHRFQVADPAALTWWPRACRALRVPPPVRADLEDGRLPAHWWISLEPVAVTPGQAAAPHTPKDQT